MAATRVRTSMNACLVFGVVKLVSTKLGKISAKA